MDFEPNEYEELLELAKFCLITGVPYASALEMRDVERTAFLDAFEWLEKEKAKAYKRK